MDDMMKQFEKVKKQTGGTAMLKFVTLNFHSKRFFYDFKRRTRTERHGEVAFAVERKNGKFVVIRNAIYPEGVYRIPTGGIGIGEDVLSALYREIEEELGVKVKLKRFLGAIKYRIKFQNEQIGYYSFVFWMKEVSGNIIEDATQNEIFEFAEADKQFLKKISAKLSETGTNKSDWGIFRCQTTSFIIPFLDRLDAAQNKKKERQQ